MNTLISASKQLNIDLTKEQLEQFELFFEALVFCNRNTNLTTVTEYEEVLTRHFADSLTVVLGINPRDTYSCLNIVDIGSGAGFPGLPLKIALPWFNMTLIESSAKKSSFLEHVIVKLGLDRVNVVTGRAEELTRNPAYREQFDFAVSRAVARLGPLSEFCLPFCLLGGNFIALKKGNIVNEITAASQAIEKLGGSLRSVIPVNLPGLTDERQVVVIEKVKPTPSRYPRRVGIPLKRPL